MHLGKKIYVQIDHADPGVAQDGHHIRAQEAVENCPGSVSEDPFESLLVGR
jgi:hypothetical protein